jgi:hypothetical protein
MSEMAIMASTSSIIELIEVGLLVKVFFVIWIVLPFFAIIGHVIEMGIEFTALTSNSFEGVQMARFVEIFLPFLGDATFGL